MRGMMTALALAMLAATPAFIICAALPALAQEVPAEEPVATYPDIPRDAGEYLCTPGFTLIRDTGGLRLAGDIEIPTPGFSYEVTDVEEMEPGKLAGILHLSDAGGAVIQVISSLHIEYLLPQDEPPRSLTLTVDKTFNWGPTTITCTKQGRDATEEDMPE